MNAAMYKRSIGLAVALLVCGFMAEAVHAQADVQFDFEDGTELDGNSGIGTTMTRSNSVDEALTITTVDIIEYDGSKASEGSGTKMNITSDRLGVNSKNSPPNTPQDFNNFDPGEGWVINFDKTAYLKELDAASLDNSAKLTISSSAFPTMNFVDGDGGTGDTFNLQDTLVPAGTSIMIRNTGPDSEVGTTNEFRIRYLRAEIAPPQGTLVTIK